MPVLASLCYPYPNNSTSCGGEMKKFTMLILVVLLILSTGCSVKHPIAVDYGQYLTNNENKNNFPAIKVESDYALTQNTINHHYEFRAASVGYAHLWIVEFGKILDETLKSKDVQSAFGRLSKIDSEASNKGYFILFDLENYEFKNYQAFISLKISLTKDGNVIFDKTYKADGKSQGGKMFFGGPFAMKNATQQSTKLALDQILRAFIEDINTKVAATN